MPDDVHQLRRDFQEFALRFEAEVGRQQAGSIAVKDALQSIRKAIDKLAEDEQKLVGRVYRLESVLERNDGRIDAIVKEFEEWRKINRDEHNLLHTRTSNLAKESGQNLEGLRRHMDERVETLRREASTSTRESESRTMQFLRDWLPLIIAGVLALGGVTYLGLN